MDRREFLRDCLKAAGAAALGSMVLPAIARAADGKPKEEQPKIPLRVLGKTGAQVSILGFGGANWIADTDDKDYVIRLVTAAMDGGITYFDTAPNYRKSEGNLGLVMGTPRRKEIFLATKVEERTYDGTMKQVDNSLKALRTDHLDLIQIHHVWKGDTVADFGTKTGTYTALQRLKEEKVTRFIGVTGHPEYPQVKEALEMYEFDTFLGFVNPQASTQPFYTDQLPITQRKKMGVIAMKIFGGSDPAILIGDGDGKASAALLLRYALGQAITTVIPAVTTLEQLQQNIETVRTFTPLSDTEREALIARVNMPKKKSEARPTGPYPYV